MNKEVIFILLTLSISPYHHIFYSYFHLHSLEMQQKKHWEKQSKTKHKNSTSGQRG